jgi:hypothetical protein
MHNVNDRRHEMARTRQQTSDFLKRGANAGERQRAVDIFMLGVDHHDHGFLQSQRRRNCAHQF